jgi:hypothetical protein
MNSSPADSRVNCLKTSDVSGHSVSILRLHEDGDCVSETSEVFKHLTRLSAGEEFILLYRVLTPMIII